MTTNGNNHNGGRPKVDIDYEIVEKLALIQCTQVEISEILGVSVRTLQRSKEFCRIYKKGLEDGHSSLRRLQWKTAEGDYLARRIVYTNKDGSVREEEIFAQPNPTMLIWLGKQYLEQKDKQEITGKDGYPVVGGDNGAARYTDEQLIEIISRGRSRRISQTAASKN